MDAGTIERIEISAERGAALLFAAAVAFAAFVLPRGALPQPQLGGSAALAAIAAYLLSSRVMAAVASPQKPVYSLQVFDVREIEPQQPDELLLTEADRLADVLVLTDADRLSPATASEEPLLKDALTPSDSDSRVVRLFDRKAMPTPGQLKSRIDDHLAGAKPPPPPSDASKALAEALAELRRSLR